MNHKDKKLLFKAKVLRDNFELAFFEDGTYINIDTGEIDNSATHSWWIVRDGRVMFKHGGGHSTYTQCPEHEIHEAYKKYLIDYLFETDILEETQCE